MAQDISIENNCPIYKKNVTYKINYKMYKSSGTYM